MSFSASRRRQSRRPEHIQTRSPRPWDFRGDRRPVRATVPYKVSKQSAAARLERRRRYSATGLRSEWPEPVFMTSPVNHDRCGRPFTGFFIRTPRPLVRMSDGTLVPPPSTPPPPGLSEDQIATWHQARQREEMQGAQLLLWEQGHKRLGRLDEADAFVRALPLSGARSLTTLTAEESDVPTSLLSSPTSTAPKRLSLRAIIHSRSNPPFGLKRDFDLDALRETVPEPLHSTPLPSFDREQWMSKVQLSSVSRRASWPSAASASLVKTSVADEAKTTETAEPDSPVPARGLQSMGVPINLEYARTSLPALAAIIMSDRVQRGDMIDLALPYPEAWPETVAYIYSGSVKLLSDDTRENVKYLGGKTGGRDYERNRWNVSFYAC